MCASIRLAALLYGLCLFGNYWSDILCFLFQLKQDRSDESRTALGIIKGSIAIKNGLLGALFFVVSLCPASLIFVGIRSLPQRTATNENKKVLQKKKLWVGTKLPTQCMGGA
jgi:hypothetical protein